MLRALRWQLSFLYFCISSVFVVLLGGGLYIVLDRYFQVSTDQALKFRLVQELERMQLSVPQDLANEKYTWIPRATMIATPAIEAVATIAPSPEIFMLLTPTSLHSGIFQNPVQPAFEDEEESEVEDDDDRVSESEKNRNLNPPPGGTTPVPLSATPDSHELTERITGEEPEHEYEGELSPIFVLRVDQSGNLIMDPQAPSAPIQPEIETARALKPGTYNLRTVQSNDGTKIRLMTYTLPEGNQEKFIQLGRPIDDQERLKRGFLTGLFVLGAIGLVFSALGGWLLSGRSIKPAERAWEQQQAFVANASHELRTPLTLMRASTELAQKGVRDKRTRELLKDVLSDTDYMTQLVSDLLLLSRLDGRSMRFERNAIDLEALMAEIEKRAKLLAKERGIEFTSNPQGFRVAGDSERLKQVLWILIDNAMQFTPSGKQIHLSARESGRMVIIEVKDSGAGISREHLPHVFERFYRGTSDHELRGAGLGLSLARMMVEGMGGSIKLTSKVGEGTNVSISLPKA